MIFLTKFVVAGHSMEPTFFSGTTLLVSYAPYIFRNPLINEIVVIQSPKDGRNILKRIQKIENNRYFIVGDNKGKSTDSREFGWITKKEIVGKVVWKISKR